MTRIIARGGARRVTLPLSTRLGQYPQSHRVAPAAGRPKHGRSGPTYRSQQIRMLGTDERAILQCRTEGAIMHAPANQPEFKAAVDPAVEELNRIVDQAEALLQSLGEDTGEAAEAVRERVNETLTQAKARL